MNNTQWAILMHLSGFAGLLLPGVLNWAAPLLLWLLKRTESEELDRVGKEIVNFQISYTLYSIVLSAVIFVLSLILIGLLLAPLLFLLPAVWMILMVVAAFKASSGEFYRYPLTVRFFN